MRFLLTGGAGFIGSHLADALAARGDRIVVLDDLSTGRRENVDHLIKAGAIDFVEGSVLDADLVRQCMVGADVCVHLASAVGVRLIIEQPLESLLRNVRGTDVVMEAAADYGCKVLFSSSSEIYGKSGTPALHERSDRLLGPPEESRWHYSTAKAFGEALAMGYNRSLGVRTVVVRLFNTVGPRQTGAYGMVLPRFVEQALADDDLTVYGNGTQRRSFTHVHDVIHALLLLLEKEKAVGRVFNVGSSHETPIVELARRVIKQTRSNSKIRLVPYRVAYDEGFVEPEARVPDTSALRELTGWSTTKTIDEAIDDVKRYQRNVPSFLHAS